MPIVDIKGVGKAKFPDGMSAESIRDFLRVKYSQQAVSGQSDILSPQPDTVAPYSPSLVDKIGGGIADTLTKSGLISDNYRAQQIGKNLSGIGEFLPGVGDATAGDDAGRAFAKGDYGEAAIHSVGAIPVLGDAGLGIGKFAMLAYHGTPHNVRKFSMDKIGTGEGAQVYGHGLYFAGEKEVAQHYRDVLSEKEIIFGGEPLQLNDAGAKGQVARMIKQKNSQEGWSPNDSIVKVIQDLQGSVNRFDGNTNPALQKLADKSKEAIDIAKTMKGKKIEVRETGNLYQVDIPEKHEYLDHDVQLKSMDKGIQDKILPLFKDEFDYSKSKLNEAEKIIQLVKAENRKPTDIEKELVKLYKKQASQNNPMEYSGSSIYEALRRSEGGAEKASEKLRSTGIPGMKYLDQMSRGEQGGTSNYVVWDDPRIKIELENEIPLASN